MKAFKAAIILLGRPGSGKDTQAELLAKKFSLTHIISSKLIKTALKGKSAKVEKEHRLQESGFLVSSGFVSALVMARIKSLASRGKGIIMSGSPRTMVELKDELPLLKKLYGKGAYFFHIAISPKEVYIRNLKRQRKDFPELDTRKIIKKRLAVFNRETLPVIKYLRTKKIIFNINGEQPIAKIHKDILKIIASLL
ncbi:MAG: nucleoside monophosphate kinase [Candidatus Azambacteria bacterium]|nr:nucleoside monophosphate kinase [Candidatus Azambacteria bacterium]